MPLLSPRRSWRSDREDGMGTWFKEFRSEHGFTSYGENATPVTVDVALVALTYFCVLLSLATLLSTLGIRGRERWSAALRACYALAVGSIILVCIVGHGWQTGDAGVASTSYIYRSNHPFNGVVGIKVGLRGTNVTLEGYYKGAHGNGYVYYAEEMPWAEFGQETASYSHFLDRGLPEPLLKVLEFLSVDDGGLRWGRSFHTASQYATMLLWTSFAFWVFTNLLLLSVVVYGAYMFFLTGLTMVLACVAYHTCQLDQPLVIAFGDVDLRVSYGWSYWLALSTGCVTLALGLTLIILDHFAHKEVAVFFQLETLDDMDFSDFSAGNMSEDLKGSRLPSNSSFVFDRRGFMLPGDKRRCSIFMDPGRRTNSYNENLIKSLGLSPAPSQVFSAFGPGSPGFLTRIAEADGTAGKTGKMNPVYAGVPNGNSTPSSHTTVDHQRFGTEEEEAEEAAIRSDMECVCQESQVCASPRKPSLATLREHRENHVNEKRYASSTAYSSSSANQERRRSSSSSSQRSSGFSATPRSGVTTVQINATTKSSSSGRMRRVSSQSDSSSECGIVISPKSFARFSYGSSDSDRKSTSYDEESGRTSPIFARRLRRDTDPDVIVHATQTSGGGRSRRNSEVLSLSRNVSASSSDDSGRGVSSSIVADSRPESCAEDDEACESAEEYITKDTVKNDKDVVLDISL